MIQSTWGTASTKSILVAMTFVLVTASGCLGGADVATTCGGGAMDAMAGSAGGGLEAAAAAPATTPTMLDDTQHTDPLVLGTLLPLTGSLATFGGDMQNATVLAREHINAAGGVNGQPIELVHGDTRTSPSEAPTAFLNLVNDGAVGVVGAASSGVTGSILDLAIDNNVVLVTPASTSPDLTADRDNQGYFYRVPPNDALQGQVLADLVYSDGCVTAGLIVVNNDYGVGLGDVFQQTFESMGGDVTNYVRFEEGGSTFTSQVDQVSQGTPDAVVFVGYPAEGTQVVREMFQRGILADSVLFFSEGVQDPSFVDDVGQTAGGDWVLAGLRGTTPQSPETNATQKFVDAYQDRFDDEPGLFAAESYDAVFAMALAAQYGSASTSVAIRDNILTVWNSPGTEYDGSQATQALLDAAAKMDIDYQGAANDFDWDDKGDPTTGIYAVWQVNDEGEIVTTEEGIQPS